MPNSQMANFDKAAPPRDADGNRFTDDRPACCYLAMTDAMRNQASRAQYIRILLSADGRQAGVLFYDSKEAMQADEHPGLPVLSVRHGR